MGFIGLGNRGDQEPVARCDLRDDGMDLPTPARTARWSRRSAAGYNIRNFGVHYLDMIQWSLGKKAALSVTAIGGNYEVIYEYTGATLKTRAHLQWRPTTT